VRVVKVLAPLGKANLHLPFCFFCLREKEATLKSSPRLYYPSWKTPSILERILGTALPFGRCFIALAQAPCNS